MIEKIDHEQLAISRLATQYRESTLLHEYLKIIISEANELEQTACDILEKRVFGEATAAQLDIIGELVGQPREIITATAGPFFGFQGNPVAGSFGTVADPGIGAPFRSSTQSPTTTRLVTDEEYEIFIQARIFKNNSTGRREEIIQQIITLFNAPTVEIQELSQGAATYTVIIGRVLTVDEKLLITDTDLIPKPLGVEAFYEDLDGPV